MATADDVTIEIGDQDLSGWLGVRVTRGIERFPGDFDLIATERYPFSNTDIQIQAGMPCVVRLGKDPVVTGYVDRFGIDFNAHEHTIRLQGRSKGSDLVDCSAELQYAQVANQTIGSLAKLLCDPFGIGVSLPLGDSGVIPQIAPILTETPYEIVERVARWNTTLVFDDENGDLVIAPAGDAVAASGFSEGVNIQAFAGAFDVSQRYTEIAAIGLSTSTLVNDEGEPQLSAIPYVASAQATDTSFPARADKKPRYRPLLILAEQDLSQYQLIPQRIRWEMARRTGRGQGCTITCDSWRDSAGKLWTPNTFAPIDTTTGKIKQTWLITEVTFLRDGEGTRADVTLMPKEGFVPQPTVLLPAFNQIAGALPGGGAAATQ